MITLGSNNILSLWTTSETGKQFTRNFHGYPLTAFDHQVIAINKKWLADKPWKDIGSGEAILRKREAIALQDKPHSGHSRLGYDILYKVDEEWWAKNIARVDGEILPVAHHFFGVSMSALVVPSYEASMGADNLVSFLFGIALAHGKWPMKDGVLSPVKITIPLTSSLFGKKDIIDLLAKHLHAAGFIHTLQYVQSSSYEIAQLVIHDVALLQQFVAWMKPVVNITKISTYEKRQKAYDALLAYATEQWYALPIASVDELVVLEAD
jgi:hypothetical protein